MDKIQQVEESKRFASHLAEIFKPNAIQSSDIILKELESPEEEEENI